MRKILMMTTAAYVVAFAVAHDNKAGWKLDADGKLELDGDGNPIYVNAGGQAQSVRGDTIANLNAEAKQHRTAKEAAEASLKAYEVGGKLMDAAAAAKAIETVGKMDAKQLIDAGEVDRVKETIKGEFTAQLSEAQKALADSQGEIAKLKIDKVFDASEFVREGIAVPVNMFRSTFAQNFKVEDGKVVAYGPDGNKLLSKERQGEYASPEEALKLLVDMDPNKDAILKAPAAGGSGNGGGGGARGAGRTVTREQFEAMNPHQQAEAGVAMGKGELTIL